MLLLSMRKQVEVFAECNKEKGIGLLEILIHLKFAKEIWHENYS